MLLPCVRPRDALTKVTWVLVAIFFVVTISISIVQKNEINNEFDFLIDQNNIEQIEEEIIQELPE